MVAVPEKQYDDAFTLQVVDPEDVQIFNYMAGMVPFVQKLIAEVCVDPNYLLNLVIFQRIENIALNVLTLI